MKNTAVVDSDQSIGTLELSDGYTSHYRLWGAPVGRDLIIMLHGGMSHSEWQAPLAGALRGISDISFLAPDRRGCGLNDVDRGDLKSAEILFDDVVQHVAHFKKSFDRIHLAGWCQGCQFSIPAARQLQGQGVLSSLILVTPGLFWSERFTAVQQIARESLFAFLMEFKIQPDPKRPFIPIPMLKEDFTSTKAWLDYIDGDPLKTTRVTLNTVGVMEAAQRKSLQDVLEIDCPVLVVLAEKDRVVDSARIESYLGELVSQSQKSSLIRFNAEHAIHFEKAEDLAGGIRAFISTL